MSKKNASIVFKFVLFVLVCNAAEAGDDSNDGLSGWTIFGIVMGCIGGFGLAVILLGECISRCNEPETRVHPTVQSEEESTPGNTSVYP